jgi:hypothetical protein
MIESLIAVGAVLAMVQDVQLLPRTEDLSLVARSRVSTLRGPTGLINIPTSAVVPTGTLAIGTNFSRDVRGPSLNYGLTQNVEVGATFFDIDAGPDRVYFHGKLNVIPANLPNVELAVGAMDVGHGDNQTIYVVGSAFLTPGTWIEENGRALRVHLGYGGGIFRSEIFGGAEAIMDQRWALLGEWDGRNFNGGIRYAHDENFRLQAGFAGTGLFFGANYALRF